MKQITALLFLASITAQAQVVVIEQHYVQPRIQQYVVNPLGNSHWDAKRYGPNYRSVQEVPVQVREYVDYQRAPKYVSVPVQRVVNTPDPAIPLPGQTFEQRKQMDSMTQ